MHVDLGIAGIVLGILLSSMIALQVWMVMTLNDGRVKRHEMQAQIQFLTDKIKDLVASFEKMRDKMESHIENSDCRKR